MCLPFFFLFPFTSTDLVSCQSFVVNVSKLYYIFYRPHFLQFAGDYGDKGTPLPIPNREVKLVFADGTAPLWRGRVGRCRHFLFLFFAVIYFVEQIYS